MVVIHVNLVGEDLRFSLKEYATYMTLDKKLKNWCQEAAPEEQRKARAQAAGRIMGAFIEKVSTVSLSDLPLTSLPNLGDVFNVEIQCKIPVRDEVLERMPLRFSLQSVSKASLWKRRQNRRSHVISCE